MIIKIINNWMGDRGELGLSNDALIIKIGGIFMELWVYLYMDIIFYFFSKNADMYKEI